MPPRSSAAKSGPRFLRLRRQQLGLTQLEVAERLAAFGVTRDGLARIELGQTWPNPRQIAALAEFYKVDLGKFCAEIIQAWLSVRDRYDPTSPASSTRAFRQPPARLPLFPEGR